MALLPFDLTCHRLSYRVIVGALLQSASNKKNLHHSSLNNADIKKSIKVTFLTLSIQIGQYSLSFESPNNDYKTSYKSQCIQVSKPLSIL